MALRRTAAMATRGIVDAWAQPPCLPFHEKIPEVGPLLKASHSPVEHWLKKNPDFGADEVVAQMDEAGVDCLMLCAWHRPSGPVIDNDFILNNYVKKYPKRFKGVVSVDIRDPVAAVATIDRYVRDNEHPFKAVRVVPWLWDKPPTDPLYYPLFVKCVELDIPFCTQVGHTGPLCPSETGRPIPYIDRVALDFPQLKLVCGHIGYPWTEEMIAVAWKHKNVFIDTSAYLPRYYPKNLLHFANTYGRHKVLFGTNYPQLTLGACAEQARKLPLKEEALEALLHGNARRIFKLDDDDSSAPKSRL